MTGMTQVSITCIFLRSDCLFYLISNKRHAVYIVCYNITEEYQDIIGLRLDNSTGPLVGSKAFGQNEPWYAGIMKTFKKVYADLAPAAA